MRYPEIGFLRGVPSALLCTAMRCDEMRCGCMRSGSEVIKCCAVLYCTVLYGGVACALCATATPNAPVRSRSHALCAHRRYCATRSAPLLSSPRSSRAPLRARWVDDTTARAIARQFRSVPFRCCQAAVSWVTLPCLLPARAARPLDYTVRLRGAFFGAISLRSQSSPLPYKRSSIQLSPSHSLQRSSYYRKYTSSNPSIRTFIEGSNDEMKRYLYFYILKYFERLPTNTNSIKIKVYLLLLD